MLAQAHILQNRQVNKAGRPDTIAIRIRRTIADQEESQLSLGSFNSAVGFAGFRTKTTQLRFGIHDRTGGNIAQGGFEDLERLPHFQYANHITVVNIAMIAQGHAKRKSIVDAVTVDLAQIVIDPGGAEHWTGNARVNGKFFG